MDGWMDGWMDGVIPAFSGVPKQGDKVKGGPQVGGSAMQPLRSRGSPKRGSKIARAGLLEKIP